jgi:cob(I)alamin adenosyltransferase
MKIYTRGGDSGETRLFSGKRVNKDEARIEALGALDELVSAMGLAKAAGIEAEAVALLDDLQTELYLVMADVAGEARGEGRLRSDAVARLEAHIDRMDADLPELTDFVIPGGAPGSAALHLARTICRRAERRAVSVLREGGLPGRVAAYLNRLSDLLFTLARWVERGAPEAQKTFKQRL